MLALGAGIALGVTALSQSKQLSVLAPDYATQVMDVRRTALFADLSYGLAGALAVSALVLWLVSPGTAP